MNEKLINTCKEKFGVVTGKEHFDISWKELKRVIELASIESRGQVEPQVINFFAGFTDEPENENYLRLRQMITAIIRSEMLRYYEIIANGKRNVANIDFTHLPIRCSDALMKFLRSESKKHL